MFTPDNPPESICILRLSAIGDVTHVLPVVYAIRKQWPKVKITWICGAVEYKLLSCLNDIHFVVFNKNSGLKAYLGVWKQLRGESFDLMLHMHASARANLLGLLVRSKNKLGWDDANARDGHRWFIDKKIKAKKNRHQVQGYLEFARSIGIAVEQPEWHITIPEQAMAFAREHIPAESPVLMISAASSHSLRNWRVKNYAAVADYAIEHLGMAVVLSGGPGELEASMGRSIEAAMTHDAVNLVGKDTLPQLMAMLSLADVLISPDSGPAHIANAVGTKVLGLYACTNSKRSGPYNSLHLCVDRYEIAAKKFLDKNVKDLAWNKKIEIDGVMDLIEVKDVIEKLELCMETDNQAS